MQGNLNRPDQVHILSVLGGPGDGIVLLGCVRTLCTARYTARKAIPRPWQPRATGPPPSFSGPLAPPTQLLPQPPPAAVGPCLLLRLRLGGQELTAACAHLAPFAENAPKRMQQVRGWGAACMIVSGVKA